MLFTFFIKFSHSVTFRIDGFVGSYIGESGSRSLMSSSSGGFGVVSGIGSIIVVGLVVGLVVGFVVCSIGLVVGVVVGLVVITSVVVL